MDSGQNATRAAAADIEKFVVLDNRHLLDETRGINDEFLGLDGFDHDELRGWAVAGLCRN
jgi:hypothetical protein